jgi:beta-hydroxylase
MIPQALKERFDRFVKDAGFQVIQVLERLIVRYSPHGDPAFFDARDFAWTQLLESNWLAIRDEMAAILEHRERLPNFQDISEDQTSITQDDDWKTFFLYGFGYKAETNCRLAPRTTEVVEQIPGMKTAFFSILSPGKHIPAHRGPYKGVIRAHLGLKVPEPREQCRIRVGDEVRHWEEGCVMVFDDTHNHEVWNDTDGERVVLFLDIERPLYPPMDTVNRALITLIGWSPFVQNAKANQEAWEERMEAAMA